MSENITLWIVSTDGFGNGRVYSIDLTAQHIVMQLNHPQPIPQDTTYFTTEEYARAHLADYIKNHPANQPIKEASE